MTGTAPVKLSQLEHWLAMRPSISVCGRGQLLRDEMRQRLDSALLRFKEAAAAAKAQQGTPSAVMPPDGATNPAAQPSDDATPAASP